MTTFVKKIRNDRFLKNNIIFFIGSLIVAFLNYLYYPILGRVLSLSSFGEVQVVVTILLQLTIFLTVFSYIVMNVLSNHPDGAERDSLLNKLELVALLIAVIFFLLISVGSFFFKNTLQFSSFWPFVFIAIMLVLNVPFTFDLAYLQANHDFKGVSFINVVSSVSKIIFSFFIILLGYQTMGAVWGLLIATVLSLSYAGKLASKKAFPFLSSSLLRNTKTLFKDAEIKRELRYGLFVFIILISVMLLETSDVLFIKAYFAPDIAGSYSGIATVARIILFSTASIAAVLFPAIKIGSHDENHALLKRSIKYFLLVGGFIELVFILFPSFTISILIGAKYLPLSSILPAVGLFILLSSFINLLFLYSAAVRDYKISVFSIVGVFLVVIVTYFNHNSVNAVVDNFIYINLVTLTGVLAYLFIQRKKLQLTS